MKSLKKIITTVAFVLAVVALSAQTPPPPNNDGQGGPTQDPGTGGNQPVGGNAPIGSGLFILFGLGAAYAGRKTYKLYQEKKNSLED